MRTRWLLMLALAAGCTSTADPDIDLAGTPDLDQPFALHVGEQGFVEEASLYVRFLKVEDDSRCPSHALILCVWEGDGAIVVEVTLLDDNTLNDTLHTRLDPKVLHLGAVVLELQRLDPYPETLTPIPSDEYVATFVVRRPALKAPNAAGTLGAASTGVSTFPCSAILGCAAPIPTRPASPAPRQALRVVAG